LTQEDLVNAQAGSGGRARLDTLGLRDKERLSAIVIALEHF
jgi:hypothetical protein